MEYKELSIGLSLNVVTGESWWKCDAKTTVEPGEDIFELAERVKADIKKIIHPQSPNEEMKGTITKPVVDEKQIEALIKDLDEATDLKTLMVVISEAPEAIQSNRTFQDKILSNKLRLQKQKA